MRMASRLAAAVMSASGGGGAGTRFGESRVALGIEQAGDHRGIERAFAEQPAGELRHGEAGHRRIRHRAGAEQGSNRGIAHKAEHARGERQAGDGRGVAERGFGSGAHLRAIISPAM